MTPTTRPNVNNKDIQTLVEATLGILRSQNKTTNLGHELLFLHRYILSLVTMVLNDNSITNKNEKYQHVRRNFEGVKLGVQEAVALAFQTALQNFSKTDIEYYCTIKTVPQVQNEKVH